MTIAKSRPTPTPVVKSIETVNKNVATSINESADLVFKICANSLRSLIFQATNIKIGAILASGMFDA